MLTDIILSQIHYFGFKFCEFCEGAEPLIQLYKILLKAPGVYGARFSGAGFRGCCLAFVDAEKAEAAASYVKDEYEKAQPEFANNLNGGKPVLICEAGDAARVLL